VGGSTPAIGQRTTTSLSGASEYWPYFSKSDLRFASSRSKFWEQEIHRLIPRTRITGETGEVTRDFKIEKSTTAFFQTLSDINDSADDWRPVSKTQNSDSYKLSIGALFQMTVGQTHDQQNRAGRSAEQ